MMSSFVRVARENGDADLFEDAKGNAISFVQSPLKQWTGMKKCRIQLPWLTYA